MHLKDELMPRYAELIYFGFWFSPEREMLQAAIDHSQANVSGTVRLKLYKGHALVVGRKSPKSLYSMQHVTFEEDAGAYNQRDAEGFIKLNALRLRLRGIGRIDLVENRFVGMKSRGVYETPGGTILLAAHRAIESITLDRGAAHLKDDLMPRYAELIYNGFWFTPEREMLQALIDKSQEHVEGEVRLKLYKGNVMMAGRESQKSLYSSTLVTFEDDKGAYDQKDAEGFIRLNALRLRTLGMRRKQFKLDK